MTYPELESLIIADYHANRRRSTDTLTGRLAHLRAFFGNRPLGQGVTPLLAASSIRAYISHRLAAQAAPATINRELAALRRGFTLAALPWPAVAMLAEAAPREGFITPAQFAKLRAALPAHLKDPIAFLYLSSWRLAEMRNLSWPEIHLADPQNFAPPNAPGETNAESVKNSIQDSYIQLSASRSKNGRGRILPLRGELYAIIIRALNHRSPHTELVFHNRHRPLVDFRRAWASSCTTAGFPGLLIHDLRRSAIRNFVRAGVRESVVMRLSGHETRSVFDRYNITDAADLVSAIEALGDNGAESIEP